MIRLFLMAHCGRCDEIRDVLENRCLAHRLIWVEEGTFPGDLPKGAIPPVLVDGGRVIEGAEAVLAHLEELIRFKALWDKYQSDSCYGE
jgi:hypothetical protein